MTKNTLIPIKEHIPDIHIDMRYSTTDNFTNHIVYKDFASALLQSIAVDMLMQAHHTLKNIHPSYTFLIWDAARPSYAQQILWDYVKDTPNAIYIANPSLGSLHNYGMAVDLTIVNHRFEPLDMGTPFDYFGAISHPEHEPSLLQSGDLSHEQLSNRLLLRYCMVQAGFIPIPQEWWHFNACKLEDAIDNYDIIA